MILVDTSVWIDHLRRGDAELARRLENGDVACHPFIIGELALGTMRHRPALLALLAQLPAATEPTHDEVMTFVERHRLHSSGIGWIDAHLLCSAALDRHALWTDDKSLRAVAKRLNVGYDRSRG